MRFKTTSTFNPHVIVGYRPISRFAFLSIPIKTDHLPVSWKTFIFLVHRFSPPPLFIDEFHYLPMDLQSWKVGVCVPYFLCFFNRLFSFYSIRGNFTQGALKSRTLRQPIKGNPMHLKLIQYLSEYQQRKI